MPRLHNIDAIIHIKVALPFDGYCKAFIKQVKENISRMSIRSLYCKVVHLSHEDNTIAINDT